MLTDDKKQSFRVSGTKRVPPASRQIIHGENEHPDRTRKIFPETQLPQNLQTAIENADISCFGGRVVDYKDRDGYPIKVFAVQVDQKKAEEMDSYFNLVCNHTVQGCFLMYTGFDNYGMYYCFKFNVKENMTSLRKRLEEDGRNACNPLDILAQQIAILVAYDDFWYARQEDYHPLCCISQDTVFVDEKYNSLVLLPLKSVSNDYPDELPREAGKPEASVKTDIYSAAYLTAELADASSGPKSLPDFVAGCLWPFPEWRLSLNELMNKLGMTPETGEEKWETFQNKNPKIGNSQRKRNTADEQDDGKSRYQRLLNRFRGAIEKLDIMEPESDTNATFKGSNR